MATQYVHVRIRKSDFEKIVATKKVPMEQDLKRITGKVIKIKNPELFRIAANSTWDLGTNFEKRIVGAVKIKRRDIGLP